MTKTRLIAKLHPCLYGKTWLRGKTLEQAWETCERSDWMYWALRKLGYSDDATYRKLACSHALSVAHLWDMPDIVRRYLETQDETLRDAAGVARAAAAGAAGDAAWAAADAAAGAAGDAAWAARAARAADAAARAAADAARCDEIRKLIPWQTVAQLIKEARE